MILRRMISLLVVAAASLLTACDNSFTPIQESDRYFSIYGVLDISADTQWIRVAAVRDSAFTYPGPLDAVVSLENLESGKRMVMRDAPKRYHAADSEVIEDLYAHNYWTAERIEPRTTYRLTVTRPDGVATTATVRTPARIERTSVAISQQPFTSIVARDYIRVFGADHLAMADVLHYVASPSSEISHRDMYQGQGLPNSQAGYWQADLKRYLDRASVLPPPPNVCLEASQARCEIRVVVSGSSWPYNPTNARSISEGPNSFSNVVNGVGFLGGIFTLTIPYEACIKRGIPPLNQQLMYCEIIYDSNSASLTGSVRDYLCGNQLVKDATVILTESGSEFDRVAWTQQLAGEYRIAGLVPNVTYAYAVTNADFEDVLGTVRFAPGQVLTIDFAAKRKSSCPAA